jgi:hypothetical protein
MRIVYLVATAVVFAAIATVPVSAETSIGNTVKASTTVSASGRTLRESSPLFLNDVLRSNATGVGQFVFDDGTKLAMGPSASLTIDKSIYKGASAQRTGIQASKGAFRYISGAFHGRKIATPYGTIGIRGTAFDFTIRGGKLYILLYKGAVDMCRGGACKTLNRTCDYLVVSGGRISNPQPLSVGLDAGLNVGEAFPLAVNQRQLTSSFRQRGKGCLSRLAYNSLQRQQQQVADSINTGSLSEAPGPGPAPGPSGHPNNGFGNGEERNGTPEANNPGQGDGGPHGKKNN